MNPSYGQRLERRSTLEPVQWIDETRSYRRRRLPTINIVPDQTYFTPNLLYYRLSYRTGYHLRVILHLSNVYMVEKSFTHHVYVPSLSSFTLNEIFQTGLSLDWRGISDPLTWLGFLVHRTEVRTWLVSGVVTRLDGTSEKSVARRRNNPSTYTVTTKKRRIKGVSKITFLIILSQTSTETRRTFFPWGPPLFKRPDLLDEYFIPWNFHTLFRV